MRVEGPHKESRQIPMPVSVPVPPKKNGWLSRWRGGPPAPLVAPSPKPMARALFAMGRFELSAGDVSFWKVQCEALQDADWQTIAHWMLHAMRTQHISFSEVVGVPRGGVRLAQMLHPYRSTHPMYRHPRLIVDDVLTSGISLVKRMDREDDFGFVVFARGPLPPRVRAMWKLGA